MSNKVTMQGELVGTFVGGVVIGIVLSLIVFPGSNEPSFEAKLDNYLRCSYEEDFLKHLGFHSRESCENLLRLGFEEKRKECIRDFVTYRLPKETWERLVNSCLENWIDRHELEVSKEFFLFHPEMAPSD